MNSLVGEPSFIRHEADVIHVICTEEEKKAYGPGWCNLKRIKATKKHGGQFKINVICLYRLGCKTVKARELCCDVNWNEWGCVCILSPGADGAVCLWHPWSTGSVQVPPLCRCSAHLHPELSCTPATPPLAGWSACRNTSTVLNTKPMCVETGTPNKCNP